MKKIMCFILILLLVAGHVAFGDAEKQYELNLVTEDTLTSYEQAVECAELDLEALRLKGFILEIAFSAYMD